MGLPVRTLLKTLLITGYFAWTCPAPAVIPLGLEFPITPGVEDKVKFWEKIFYRYASYQSVVHDVQNASIVVDVLDYRDLLKHNRLADTRKNRAKVTEAYLQRYRQGIQRFHSMGPEAAKYGAIEERLWVVYSANPEMKDALLTGKVNLRSQDGLADIFIEAATRAQRYLPRMETIFKEHGVPPIITRLPFVESMFQLEAHSKVGAVGVWQFMMPTGRHYLHINALVDERRSPLKATEAAAKFLSNSYTKLGSWPLTITSYNFGLSGIMRAVKALNTTNFDTILENYKSPQFQYASKNFYAEYLAAVRIYNLLMMEKRVKNDPAFMDIGEIVLPHSISVKELLAKTGVNEAILKTHNPCLKPEAFGSLGHHKLPAAYRLFLPGPVASYTKNLLLSKNSR